MVKSNEAGNPTFEKKCFIVAPIGPVDSVTRRRSDEVFEFLLKPVLQDLGYQAIRGDMINHPGTITSQIIEHLVQDELVIADLTGTNANVLYELAVRHTISKPFIQIAASEKDLPLDIVQNRAIFFDYQNLPSSAKFQETLREQIISVENNPDQVSNPVSNYLAVQKIRTEKIGESQNPESQLTADIYERLEKYSDYFKTIEAGISKMLAGLTENPATGAGQSKYIVGEAKAFEALTEVTKRAKTVVRSTRFFPDSVLTQPAYVNAMEQRVNGGDGKPALKHYYRIIALNNPEKQKDIFRHLNSFQEKPFKLYLTSNENAYELVDKDDTDVFIHYYKQEKIIEATLHIQGDTVVNQFIEIFNKLKERDLIEEFDCEEITRENFTETINQVDEIFKRIFYEGESEK